MLEPSAVTVDLSSSPSVLSLLLHILQLYCLLYINVGSFGGLILCHYIICLSVSGNSLSSENFTLSDAFVGSGEATVFPVIFAGWNIYYLNALGHAKLVLSSPLAREDTVLSGLRFWLCY